jgi:uncharacterized protein (DUF608 family)
LRQWQLHNIGNHLGSLPGSFFCIRAARIEPPLDLVRILQAPPPPRDAARTPLVDDDAVPDWQRTLLETEPGVEATTFRAVYPFAELDYHDAELPVQVSSTAFTPFVPLNAADSGLPVAMFTFRLLNPGPIEVHGWLGATVQNAVGGDGVTAPAGVTAPGYGGNVNRVRRHDGWTMLILENPSLPPDDPGAGQQVLACDGAGTSAALQWTDPKQFLGFLRGRSPVAARSPFGLPPYPDTQWAAGSQRTAPSTTGSTWCGGVTAPFTLAPGESREIRFLLAWNFPNRYVNFDQFGPPRPEWTGSRFYLGNYHSTRFADAIDVAQTVIPRWTELLDNSFRWIDSLLSTSLPLDIAERMAAQAIPLRTPTTFRAADGRFYGFEGVLGASTVMSQGDVGGSCPMNCTHVWNYAHAGARLFPELERNMRETEFDVMQAPEGYLPHRLIAPTFLPQLWDVVIGGPDDPALDGMLGTVLKSYREVRAGAPDGWLARYWPRLLTLIDHICKRWDPDGTGVLRGRQPSTYDIDLCGVNSYMGSLWLAALRAAEELARTMGDTQADRFRGLFTAGSAAYDQLLWNGEYYFQLLDESESRDFQWGDGCLSDQLIGQWWAHELDLGYLLPVEHVRSALQAVVRHNLRRDFRDFTHPFRTFADKDDTGLLLCSWPRGGRPETPVAYADEVWSGVEYQVAAHCLREGLRDEALAVLRGLWSRHDGRRRNPFNEIECGDHYARSMAGWTVLEAITGQRFDALTRSLSFDPMTSVLGSSADALIVPFVTDTAWGRAHMRADCVEFECRYGTLRLREICVPSVDWTGVHVSLNDKELGTQARPSDRGLNVRFEAEISIAAGQSLALRRGA